LEGRSCKVFNLLITTFLFKLNLVTFRLPSIFATYKVWIETFMPYVYEEFKKEVELSLIESSSISLAISSYNVFTKKNLEAKVRFSFTDKGKCVVVYNFFSLLIIVSYITRQI
jgi:hypothetical protein